MEPDKKLKVLCENGIRNASDKEISLAAEAINKSRLVSISGIPEAIEFIYKKIKNKKRENFVCVFLDNQNRPMSSRVMFRGTPSSCSVSTAEIVKRAIRLDASGIVVAHNHPSGYTVPSPADRDITDKIKTVCDCLDIRFLDHIIVGRNSHEYYSFRESGRV